MLSAALASAPVSLAATHLAAGRVPIQLLAAAKGHFGGSLPQRCWPALAIAWARY